MKLNKTFLGVIAFIVALIFAAYSSRSEAEEYMHIGLGNSLINSHLKTGEIGYEINNWEFQATLMEEGETKNGFQEQLELYSVSYLTKPNWSYKGIDPYFRLGISGNSGSQLVGDSNFRLGVGLNFHKTFRLEWSHHSSAGIHPVNSGIDYVTLSYQTPTPW